MTRGSASMACVGRVHARFFLHRVVSTASRTTYRVTRPFCFLFSFFPCARLHSGGGIARARNKSKSSDVPPQTVVFFSIIHRGGKDYIYIHNIWRVCSVTSCIPYVSRSEISGRRSHTLVIRVIAFLFLRRRPPFGVVRAPARASDIQWYAPFHTVGSVALKRGDPGVVRTYCRNRHKKRKRRKPITGEEKKNYKHINARCSPWLEDGWGGEGRIRLIRIMLYHARSLDENHHTCGRPNRTRDQHQKHGKPHEEPEHREARSAGSVHAYVSTWIGREKGGGDYFFKTNCLHQQSPRIIPVESSNL